MHPSLKGLTKTARMDPKLRMAPDAGFLMWMADRIVHVYGESPNVDFVLKLREIADRLDKKG